LSLDLALWIALGVLVIGMLSLDAARRAALTEAPHLPAERAA
jgi:hypothetical protein